MERRYQVFISSTFRDLIAERQAVLLAIQRLTHLPAGMELFPSADDAPWEVIERIIDASDYYVLIVGGRYGSTDENGISFTEREYELAVSKDIPVLAFLHADPGKLPSEHCEMDPTTREKLDRFRTKVEGRHHCAYWRSPDDLATSVVVGLVNQIAQNPKPGWVRGTFADERELLLSTVEAVRRENDSLRLRNEQLSTVVAEADVSEFICQGNDPVVLKLHRRVELDQTTKVETDDVATTWHEIFMSLAWEAISGAPDRTLMRSVAKKYGERYYMQDDTWRQIVTQFLALDLLTVRQEMRPSEAAGIHAVLSKHPPQEVPTDVWQLTEKGRRLFAHFNAVRRIGS